MKPGNGLDYDPHLGIHYESHMLLMWRVELLPPITDPAVSAVGDRHDAARDIAIVLLDTAN